ncbi:MAG: glycosyltransferase family 4 protein [Burkholderiales bacterium]|nr:glycosyltransferase family 4 protein [Burkholderiales bacterium]
MKTRLAVIVSHPIQYYVPLYKRLARRDEIDLKVFFTWHAGQTAVQDHGFRRPVVWDIPLTEGYECELVPNISSDPGTHHFFGLRNPSLVNQLLAWCPDAVHITGWAWMSHFVALRSVSLRGIPTLFRGDSHLLDSSRNGLRWWFKRAVLERVYSLPAAFLYVGGANRAYYETFGVKLDRLYPCPHSIDVARFSDSSGQFEREAAQWRQQLGIQEGRPVLLFAGKFEQKKRPLELMRAVQSLGDPNLVLVLIGGGELESEIKVLAAANPDRFRVLPFQNQSRMPIAYRLGDILVLPSAFGETWGLAVNEAMACGRPVLVSDRVGCANDIVDASCGRVFPWGDITLMMQAANEMSRDRVKLSEMARAAALRAWAFDVSVTENALMDCLLKVRAK